MIKAIFFDQDNTIFNSSQAGKISYQKTFDALSAKFNIPTENLYNDWVKIVDKVKFEKDPAKRFFEYSLKLLISKFNLNLEIQEYLKIFYDTLEDEIQLIHEADQFFNLEKKLIYIVFTEDSKKQSDIKLNKFGLNSKIDLRISSDDIGVMKPNIKFIEFGLNNFGLNYNECIFVGDNWEKDCEIGQSNGGIGVIVGEDARANYQINSLLELVDIIKNS